MVKTQGRRKGAHHKPFERGVCLFHNDGERLYAFPDTWQAMHDFLHSKQEFEVVRGSSAEEARPANTTVWGGGLEVPTDFFYGRKKKRTAVITLSGPAGTKVVTIPANSSYRLAYRGHELRAYRF